MIAAIGLVGKQNEPLWLHAYKDGLAMEALDTGLVRPRCCTPRGYSHDANAGH